MTTNEYQGLSLSTRLEKFLESDDDVSFVNWFRDEQPPIDVDIINSLVNKCVELDALKCLIALIKGQVCNMHPTFDAATKLPDSGVTFLAYIAHSCPEDPQLIDLMLTKCGGACLANVYCTIGVIDGLPIHFLLFNLSVMEHLFSWERKKSLIKLAVLLCLWETKPILDSLRVLVKYTDSINAIAWSFLKNGGLKQFAALLLIAREKVTAPFDTGLTINHYIATVIDSIDQDELSFDKDEYICFLKDAQTLLAMFEIIGDDLSLYCSSMQKYDSVHVNDVVMDIRNLFRKNKIEATINDIDLCDCSIKGYLREAISELIDAQSRELPGRIKRFCPSALGPPDYIKDDAFRRKYHSKLHFGKALPIPKCLQEQLDSTEACQARNMSKSVARTSVKPVPAMNWGCIPQKFISRTIRYL